MSLTLIVFSSFFKGSDQSFITVTSMSMSHWLVSSVLLQPASEQSTRRLSYRIQCQAKSISLEHTEMTSQYWGETTWVRPTHRSDPPTCREKLQSLLCERGAQKVSSGRWPGPFQTSGGTSRGCGRRTRAGAGIWAACWSRSAAANGAPDQSAPAGRVRHTPAQPLTHVVRNSH